LPSAATDLMPPSSTSDGLLSAPTSAVHNSTAFLQRTYQSTIQTMLPGDGLPDLNHGGSYLKTNSALSQAAQRIWASQKNSIAEALRASDAGPAGIAKVSVNGTNGIVTPHFGSPGLGNSPDFGASEQPMAMEKGNNTNTLKIPNSLPQPNASLNPSANGSTGTYSAPVAPEGTLPPAFATEPSELDEIAAEKAKQLALSGKQALVEGIEKSGQLMEGGLERGRSILAEAVSDLSGEGKGERDEINIRSRFYILIKIVHL